MCRILIFGGTGLLGNTVSSYFSGIKDFSVTSTYRSVSVKPDGDTLFFDVLSDDLFSIKESFDYVINCIGIIKPFMKTDPVAAIKINSLFPLNLAKWCEEKGARLIHITTDCVYSGKKGKYTETDPHDALDAYGKSKSLGEPGGCLLLRTSIIGEERHKNSSLVEWAKSQKGQAVNGFATHYWNGVTTKQYAKTCHKIIADGLYQEGLFHIHAKDDVSKCTMLHYFNKKFDLSLKIDETFPEMCDRTLRTAKPLLEKLDIPSVEQMIDEM